MLSLCPMDSFSEASGWSLVEILVQMEPWSDPKKTFLCCVLSGAFNAVYTNCSMLCTQFSFQSIIRNQARFSLTDTGITSVRVCECVCFHTATFHMELPV